jgi:hypothetical protein
MHQCLQGNCTTAFPGVLEAPLQKDNQCVISVSQDFAEIREPVWFSNLYFQFSCKEAPPVGEAPALFAVKSDLYLTNVACIGMGDSRYTARAVDLLDPPSFGLPGASRLYASGALPCCLDAEPELAA